MRVVERLRRRTARARMRRNRFGYWRHRRSFKRAIVKVHPEDRIELF